MANGLTRWAGKEALADYTAEDQQSYQDMFAPQTMALREIGLGMGAGNTIDAANRAVSTAGRTFDSTRGAYARDVERTGMGVDEATASSRDRRMSLARVIQQVDAGNRASQGAKAAQRAAQTWGMEQFGEATASANQTLSDVANKESDRDAQYRAAKEGKKNSDAQAGAALAMMALMFI